MDGLLHFIISKVAIKRNKITVIIQCDAVLDHLLNFLDFSEKEFSTDLNTTICVDECPITWILL